MKRFRMILTGLVAAGALTLAGCGGSGSSGPAPEVPTPVAEIEFETDVLAPLDDASTFSAGIAISADGIAVGYGDDGTGITKGIQWDISDPLSAMALMPLADNDYSAAYGVSNGTTVGESGFDEDMTTRAVYWNGSNVAVLLNHTDLPEGPSAAYSVNSFGEVVGEAADMDGNLVAVFWPGLADEPVILDNLLSNDGASSAYFISEDGRIVGESLNADGLLQAVMWEPDGSNGYLSPVALDVVNNDQMASVAFGIDLAGRIVGEAEVADNGTKVVHGVLWAADGSIIEEVAGVSFQAVNTITNNQIVGYDKALSGGDEVAMIWNRSDVADSQELAPAFSMAFGINDGSQVVGIADNLAVIAVPVLP